MLLTLFLVFCSTALLVAGVGMLFVRQQRRSVERLMTEQIAAALVAGGAGEQELSILKDSSLSGIGPLQRMLLRFRAGGKLKRLLEQADMKMKTGTLVLLIAVCSMVGFLLCLGFRLGILASMAAGVLGGFLPVLVVMRIRTRRFRRFEAQFPDAAPLMP